MYSRRSRRQKTRRIAGVLVVAVAAVLAGLWFKTPRLLTGERPSSEQSIALKPLATQTAGPSSANPKPKDSSSPGPSLTPARAQPTATPPQQAKAGPNKPAATKTGLIAAICPSSQPAPKASPAQSGPELLRSGLQLRSQDKLIEARAKINTALHTGLSATEMKAAREALADLADRTLFNRGVLKDDPLASWHTVSSGDTMGRIAKRANVSEELLAQINNLRNKNFIREGQRLKVLQGPFNASINKRTHEMHLYLQNVYVRTLKVALGENGSTPTGRWKVINHLENPHWVDPRTGKRWHPDDPANPLGEYWIGLEGIEGEAVGQMGYGIHGTVEPETIGQDVSMGCVRLAADDIALVYKLLLPRHSYVVIRDGE